MLWTWLKRGAPQVGSLFCRWRNLVSPSTKVPSEMPLLSDMAGNQHLSPPRVPVAPVSLWSMPFRAQWADFPSYDTMRSEILQQLMSEVYHDVCIEPTLQPITGEALSGASAITEDGARLDVAANGFWGDRFDVKVFNPRAPSNRQPLSSCHRKHENIKKLAYEQRVREVEHGSFTPLVMSLTVGLGSAATTFYKRLASLCSLPNGNSPTAVLWPGSVAACHSLFYSRQSGA